MIHKIDEKKSIEYRLPNYGEAILLMGEIGFGSIKNEDDTSYLFILQGKTVNHIDKFITKTEGFNSLDELRESTEHGHVLGNIAEKILERVFGFINKKKD